MSFGMTIIAGGTYLVMLVLIGAGVWYYAE